MDLGVNPSRELPIEPQRSIFSLGNDLETSESRTSAQSIILILESGHIVLLALACENSIPLFKSGRHQISQDILHLQPGANIAVDPRSRYLAIACSESLFTVYALRSHIGNHETTSRLDFVSDEIRVYVNGVILKIDFLYPSQADQDHVVLLLVVSRKGRSRLLIYEWIAGAELRTLKQHGSEGHMLSEQHQMPLLLVPLRFETTFLMIFEDFMASFRGILEGPPLVEEFSTECPPPTPHHHGLSPPLWISWARPLRVNPNHVAQNDDVFIAREDGLIKFLELNKEDFVQGDSIVAHCPCHIGSAFTTLDYTSSRRFGDLLIAGGSAGVGITFFVSIPFPVRQRQIECVTSLS